MLVTLMVTEASAQKAQFSLDAQYEAPVTQEEKLFTNLDLLQEEYLPNYEEEVRVSSRSRYRSRYSRRDARWDIDKYYPRRGTENFVNVYIGLNNYLQDDELPNSSSLLSLNPITSYYAAINFDNITRIFGPLYLDWGAGVSIQDFSFENTRTRLVRGDNEISFGEVSGITGRKSKLSVSHINVHFVPTISFGRYGAFRVGFGVYGGYRIGAHTKTKYDDNDGNKQKDKIKDNYFVNPYKYGFRATVGWDFFDLFFNYDVTELFEEEVNAPRLNPVTFGVVL